MNDEGIGYTNQYGADMQNNSRCSSSDSESDLSISLLVDREVDNVNYRLCGSDELPVFEIRLISPHGRTPSPIDNEEHATNEIKTPKNISMYADESPNSTLSKSDFVTLHEINSQISPPGDGEEDFTRNSSLETIYENVFLSTPPRSAKMLQMSRSMGSRSIRIEKVALNRVNALKETFSDIIVSEKASCCTLTNVNDNINAN